MITNNNRKITITRTDPSDKDWKTNLSYIIGLCDNPGATMLDSTFLNECDVDTEIDLLLDNNLPNFKTSNQTNQPMKSLFGDGFSTLATAVSAVTPVISSLFEGNGISSAISNLNDSINSGMTSKTFQPWFQNIQTWDGAGGGITFSHQFNFALGQYGLWNAKKEVVKPILNLIAPALPRKLDVASVSGPYPNTMDLIMKLISDVVSIRINKNEDGQYSGIVYEGQEYKSKRSETMSSMMNDFSSKNYSGALENLGKLIENLVISEYAKYTYTVSFGKIVTFKHMLITDAEWTFGTEVDQSGWPISGSATISFKGNIPLSLTSSQDDNMSVRFGG